MSIFELVTGGTITANDPGFPEQPSSTPDQFGPSTDPNRFTIWIPTEHVTVNMGNPVFTPPGSTANTDVLVQVDAGFVAQTDHHVHFHTFGDVNGTPATAPERTVVRLGTPTTVVQAVSTYASTSTNSHTATTPTALPFLQTTGNVESTDIGSAYPPPYNTWDGYAMVTEGGSYQESWGNNLIVSATADVRLGAQRMVVIGSPGDVHIFAHGDNMPGVVGNMTNDDDSQDGGKWVTELTAWKALDVAIGAIGVILSGVGLYMGIAHAQYSRPSAVGEPGWKGFGQGTAGETFNDWVGFAGTFLSPAFGIYTAYSSLKDLISPSPGPNKSVTLYGDATVSVYGKSGATIHTDLALSASGAVAASLTSGLTTTVSSLVATAVSGLSASVSGLLSVGMSSALGSATVTGKSTAQLSSWGKVFVAGNDDVQVNSMEHQVFVHGNEGFYLGCGAPAGTPITTGFPFFGATTGMSYSASPAGGADDPAGATCPGYGIVAKTASGLQIGKMQNAHVFTSPDPLTTQLISISDSKLTLQHQNAILTLEKNQIKIGNGSEERVLIGG